MLPTDTFVALVIGVRGSNWNSSWKYNSNVFSDVHRSRDPGGCESLTGGMGLRVGLARYYRFVSLRRRRTRAANRPSEPSPARTSDEGSGIAWPVTFVPAAVPNSNRNAVMAEASVTPVMLRSNVATPAMNGLWFAFVIELLAAA